MSNSDPTENIHFVTGRLAESSLRHIVEQLKNEVGFQATIDVLPITVAALMTPEWIAKRINVPPGTHRVVLPGYCHGDLTPIRSLTTAKVEVGPKDLRQLPKHFGKSIELTGYGQHDISIIAEINHAARLTTDQAVEVAKDLVASGADVVDVGCDPEGTFWPGVDDCVRAIRDQGIAVSIDSLNPKEIELATRAGAQLVLSVNHTNRHAAPDWGCEVVVIPDDIRAIESMEETIGFLSSKNVPFRIDPILEPIGLGFAASIQRYFAARQRWPEFEMMMGIGNITELTDVDSAGVNLILLALCQEIGIRSVLTTEVINWARTSVAECDRARKLVHFSNFRSIPPKHIDDDLIILRDVETASVDTESLDQLADQIRDNDLRIFADGKSIHVVGAGIHEEGPDPFQIFDFLEQQELRNMTPSHAFYLGYEMSKAMTANTLGKRYTQDESLNWGFLTITEDDKHRISKRAANKKAANHKTATTDLSKNTSANEED